MAEAKKIRYVGPFRSVDVAGLGNVKRNHQVEVADQDLAASLLDQADWEEVGKTKKTDPPADPPTND